MSISESLSPQQVTQLASQVQTKLGKSPVRVPVVMYDQIISAKDLNGLFGEQNSFVIFYPFASTGDVTIGHFTCLIRNPEHRMIYYYDPLGHEPDKYKSFSPMRKQLYQEKVNSLIKHLVNLDKQGYTIDFNHRTHQSRSPKIGTCGRHCAVRCALPEISNDDYHANLVSVKRSLGLKGRLFDTTIMKLTT